MQEKQILRTNIKQRLNELDAAFLYARSREICTHILETSVYQQAKSILCYASFGPEVDTSYFAKRARQDGKILAYPVCGNDYEMEAFVPKCETALRVGKYGICEPDISKSKQISPDALDLIITPGLAFDWFGGRLGRGAGYYDRFFLRAAQAYRLGVCFVCQMMERVPMEEYDLYLHGLATEEKYMDFSGKHTSKKL